MMLFDFEGLEERTSDEGKSGISETLIWGCSSAGRAPALHAGGQEFDPPHLHQRGQREEEPKRFNRMGA